MKYQVIYRFICLVILFNLKNDRVDDHSYIDMMAKGYISQIQEELLGETILLNLRGKSIFDGINCVI